MKILSVKDAEQAAGSESNVTKARCEQKTSNDSVCMGNHKLCSIRLHI